MPARSATCCAVSPKTIRHPRTCSPNSAICRSIRYPAIERSSLRRLEVEHSALRLTVDEWHIRLFGNDVHDESDEADWSRHNARHATIEELLWATASRALALGLDVILDFGFWSRSERDELRERARDLGAGLAIHYAEVPEELMLERIRARNARLPAGTFYIPQRRLKEWMRAFEPPSPDELRRALKQNSAHPHRGARQP